MRVPQICLIHEISFNYKEKIQAKELMQRLLLRPKEFRDRFWRILFILQIAQ